MVYIPTIAFGTGSKWKWHDVTTYVQLALESGFSHLDTAAFYETEPFVGRAINESGLSRKDLFLTTKCGLMIPLRNSLKDSLEKLGVEYVDLFLIYNHFFVPDIKEAWKEMERLKEEGLTRSIGVSNYEVKHLRDTLKVAKVKPAVNQISLNPYNYAEMRPIIDYCQENGIVVEAYSSLAPITTYPGGPVDIPITAAALRLGITPTQVIFLWVRAKGAVIVTPKPNFNNPPPIPTPFILHFFPPPSSRLPLPFIPITHHKPCSPPPYPKPHPLTAPTSLTHEEIAAIDHAGANGPPPGPGPSSQPESTSFRSSPLSSSFHLSPLSRILSSLSSWSSPSPSEDAGVDLDVEKSPLVTTPTTTTLTIRTTPTRHRHPPTKLILVGVIIILLLSITFILGIVLVLMGLLC
ncbi:hypothetical protein D9758_013402 [Tetrapyrgos nigripes]|uniref:NADP-dependent oxidoreductase domain-containing protein n=1 Tax=Tetrapyrgos nigripes TaxID=182062 RepID=A0A8H5CL07_9AGAR|nr:hypothetical protein D9758_013402 [Tetrapyrgos nigripes]